MTQRESRKIAAILAADVVDYSRLMSADEAGTLATLAIRRATFDTLVHEFDGRVFGSVGDSLMAQFASAVNAVQCAQAIQGAFANENAAIPAAGRMRLRIGVNLGDVIEDKDGVAGDAVNVAARLQALAKPGGIMISGAVHEQVRLKPGARYVDAGTRQVKNIAVPIRTFEVLPAAAPGIKGRIADGFSRFASRRVLRAVAITAAFIVVGSLGLFWREIPLPATGEKLGSVLDSQFEAPPPNSIAVLPFINMTGDPGNDYLGEGIAEELLQRLSRVAGLRVAARRSAFAYKGKEMDVRQIAEDLGVSYVVEGSIRRQGGRVRVNAALVEHATGTNRWSNSYESSGDFFAIEDEIGTRVLTALEQVLGTRHAVPHRRSLASAAAWPTTSTCRDSPTSASPGAAGRSMPRSNCSGARWLSSPTSRARRLASARRPSSATRSRNSLRTSLPRRSPAARRRLSTALRTKYTKPSVACGSRPVTPRKPSRRTGGQWRWCRNHPTC